MNVKQLFMMYKNDFEKVWDYLYEHYYMADVEDTDSISAIYDDFEMFWIQITGKGGVNPTPHKKAKHIYLIEINEENDKYFDIMCSDKIGEPGRVIKNLNGKEILYLEIIPSNYYQFRPEHFIAHLLYDMTFDGFDINKPRHSED